MSLWGLPGPACNSLLSTEGFDHVQATSIISAFSYATHVRDTLEPALFVNIPRPGLVEQYHRSLVSSTPPPSTSRARAQHYHSPHIHACAHAL